MERFRPVLIVRRCSDCPGLIAMQLQRHFRFARYIQKDRYSGPLTAVLLLLLLEEVLLRYGPYKQKRITLARVHNGCAASNTASTSLVRLRRVVRTHFVSICCVCVWCPDGGAS